MLFMAQHPLLEQVGGGWALKIESFLGPVKWHRVDRRVLLGAQKTRDFQGPTPPTCPSNGCFPHQKHYVWGRINHRCIGGFMYKSPPWRGLCKSNFEKGRELYQRINFVTVCNPIWCGGRFIMTTLETTTLVSHNLATTQDKLLPCWLWLVCVVVPRHKIQLS